MRANVCAIIRSRRCAERIGLEYADLELQDYPPLCVATGRLETELSGAALRDDPLVMQIGLSNAARDAPRGCSPARARRLQRMLARPLAVGNSTRLRVRLPTHCPSLRPTFAECGFFEDDEAKSIVEREIATFARLEVRGL